jgi:DNA invertase Pin-like site-specific DNA recombinase
MPQIQPLSNQPNVERKEVVTAAVYARVSSTGQLGRDGDDDGYSIPAQVKACEHEAETLGAVVVKAYVERAESARSDDRPVLQQMMHELETLGVRYLIVHKVDRLARNRLDDATLYERLLGMKVKLVSASENIDETPAGRLMHGMLATFAEYYSNNLATEIRKGLDQKHLTGGTPFKPPIGYLPHRELIGSQDNEPSICMRPATGRSTASPIIWRPKDSAVARRPSKGLGRSGPTPSTNCSGTPTTWESSSTKADAYPMVGTHTSSIQTPSTMCKRSWLPVPSLGIGRTSTSTTCEAPSTAPSVADGCSTGVIAETAGSTSTSAASIGSVAKQASAATPATTKSPTSSGRSRSTTGACI